MRPSGAPGTLPAGGAIGRAGPEGLAVQALRRLDHGLDGESLRDPDAGLMAHRLRERRVLEDALDGVGQCTGIARGHEEAGLALGDQLGVSPDPSGHHRLARGHRLHDGVGHALLHRRDDGDIAGGEQPRHIPPRSREGHAVAQPQRLRFTLQLALAGCRRRSRGTRRSGASSRGWPRRAGRSGDPSAVPDGRGGRPPSDAEGCRAPTSSRPA